MIRDIELTKSGKHKGLQLSAATVNLTDMGEKTITAQIKLNGAQVPDFTEDWELTFKGERYIMPLRTPAASKENTSLNSTIDLTFQHWAVYQLKRYYFCTLEQYDANTVVPDQFEASVQLNLVDFVDLFNRVLKFYYGDTIHMDLHADWAAKASTEAISIEISYSYVWDVLLKFYELWKVRWEIVKDPNTDYYVICVGYPDTEMEHYFEYGFEGGLLKVERQVQDENIRNKIYGRGGEKNLPKYYFKEAPENSNFASDPDAIPELANIPFTELHSKEFRDYVRGWKRAHYNGAEYLPATDAYTAGLTDTTFNPWEYVKDDASIAKYGELIGAAEKNEEIYPSIQNVILDGLGMADEVVDVQQMNEEDDILAEAVKQAQTNNWHGGQSQVHKTYKTFTEDDFDIDVYCGKFSVAEGKTAALFADGVGVTARIPQGKTPVEGADYEVMVPETLHVFDRNGKEIPSQGVPAGEYTLHVTVHVRAFGTSVTKNKKIYFIAGVAGFRTIESEADPQSRITFDVWIKDIWQSVKRSGETDMAFAERVWLPILGDKEGNEAKVVFTSGALAVAEDYEFTIVKPPVYDTSKSIDGVDSFWRLTLARSTADYESTGKYVPWVKRQGKAGDHFVFTGIELPHQYVLWVEKCLQAYKQDQLQQVSEIKPTWVVTTDRVRLNAVGADGTKLIDKLKVGASVRLRDPRFIVNTENTEADYETLYLQSLNYTYREPSSDDAALNPDVEMVLSNDYKVTASPVAQIQGSIDALQQQVVGLANLEQLIRAVGDKLYLRKDGIADLSASPTEFANILTSYQFRQGMVGGKGWGFYRDANGKWVLETDRLKAREDFEVNNLIVNQISARGGMIVESAAAMEVSAVEELGNGSYRLYYDSKQGSVPNLWHEDDIVLCWRFQQELINTNANDALKYYQGLVTDIHADGITIFIDGYEGNIPQAQDNLVQWGNTNDLERQYVIVRDVIGGGYERYIEGLDHIGASGVEYYFCGRQQGMYNNKPRWYIGNEKNYIEYVNGELNIKAKLTVESTIGDKTIADYIAEQIGEQSVSLYALGTSDGQEVIPVQAESDGWVDDSTLGTISKTLILRKANGEKMADNSWSLTMNGKGCTVAMVQSKKQFTLDQLNADVATIECWALIDGVQVAELTISIYKVIPGEEGSPGSPGTSARTYSLQTSADIIARRFDDSLNPTSVTCTTYIQNGNSTPVATNALTLKVLKQGASTTEDSLSRTNGVATVSSIPAACTALAFTLYDGGTAVARKTIPILYDSEESAEMMRNHALQTQVPKEITPTTNTATKATFFSAYKYEGVNLGDTLTISFDYDVVDATLTSESTLGLRLLMDGNNGWDYAIMLQPLVNGSGQRYEKQITLSSNTMSHSLGNIAQIRLYGVSGGKVIIRNFMMQVCKKVAPWSANPNDPNYLIKALQGSTTISGGLVLTSMVEVGDKGSGSYTVTAGMSGIMGDDDSETPAFWAGGTYDQAANREAAYCTFMDGTGYMAHNVLRFNDQSVDVGPYINLSTDGLKMNIGGYDKMRLGNYGIDPEYVMNMAIESASGVFDWAGTDGEPMPTYVRALSGGSTITLYYSTGQLPSARSITFGSVAQGSVLSFGANSYMRISVGQEYKGRLVTQNPILYIQPYNGTTKIGSAFPIKADGSTVDAEGSINYKLNSFKWTAPQNYSSLHLSVYWENQASMTSDFTYNKIPWPIAQSDYSSDGLVKLTCTPPERNLTIIGNNGSWFSWGKAQLFISTDYFGAKVGNHGLKIKEDGVYICRDGKTWTKL